MSEILPRPTPPAVESVVESPAGSAVRPDPPAAIVLAFRCWLAGVVLVVLALPVLLLTGMGELTADVWRRVHLADPEVPDQAHSDFGFFLLPVVLLVLLLVPAWFFVAGAMRLREGNPAGRTALAGLAVPGLAFVLGSAWSLFSGVVFVARSAAVVWTASTAGVTVVALVAMYRPSASEYLREVGE
ncbi:hypothetical protein [Actinosynnema sp. NPDC020468]|uniref:hypothetical protein n=1 Tax=Actinosynnema sp. NPDC020468 TaxID=3154488 RepID=UPI0033DBB260